MSECTGPGCEHPEHVEFDPVVKYDGRGNAVRVSDMGLNRAGRRQALRDARRAARRKNRGTS